MAIAIKSIPVLKDTDAKNFNDKAYKNYQDKKESVNFTKQVKSAEKILTKAAL